MSAAIATATEVVTRSGAVQLSDDALRQGVEILDGLQTVERARRHRDPFDMAAGNVIKNEQCQPRFIRYIRKVAGYEAPNQKAVVEYLLGFCYEEISLS